jgi:hypothetical protein
MFDYGLGYWNICPWATNGSAVVDKIEHGVGFIFSLLRHGYGCCIALREVRTGYGGIL